MFPGGPLSPAGPEFGSERRNMQMNINTLSPTPRTFTRGESIYIAFNYLDVLFLEVQEDLGCLVHLAILHCQLLQVLEKMQFSTQYILMYNYSSCSQVTQVNLPRSPLSPRSPRTPGGPTGPARPGRPG